MTTIPNAGGAGDIKSFPSSVDYEPDDAQPAPPRYVPFPVNLLPPPAAGIVRAGVAAIGCDAAYVALPALAAMAASIGNARHAVVKAGWIEPPLIWAMLVGPSGTAKTPAAKTALGPLHDRHGKLVVVNEEKQRAYRDDVKRYEAQLAQWKGKGKGEGDPPAEPEPPVLERAIIDDTTIEALAPILRANPRGVLLHRDELAGWIGGFDRYAQNGGGDVARWLSIFNVEPITVDRKSSGTTYVPRPAVCVVGGIQPDRLPAVLSKTLRDSGLLARILIAHPPAVAKKFNAADLDGEAADEWQAMLAFLASLPMDADEEGKPRPGYVGMTNPARRIFGRWADAHNAVSITLSADVAAARSKLEAYAVRFALVFTICDGSAAIEPAHVERGTALADWFAAEAQRIYEATVDASDEDREIAVLEAWIANRGGRATLRELTHGIRRYRGKADQAEAAAARLVATGRAIWNEDTGRPGRPTRVLVLRSDVPVVPVTDTLDSGGRV